MGYYFRDSYTEFLRFADDVRWELQGSRLAGVATTQELKALRLDVRGGNAAIVNTINQSNAQLAGINNSIDDLHGTVKEGFLTLHSDLQGVSNSIYALGALFDWHLDRVVTRLGTLGDSLEDLVKTSASPEQTWAYEQYESARLAYDRELYEEAIIFLERAISGYGTHTGYILERRFHHLLGDLYAKHGPGTGDTTDLDRAEAAYIKAARYARKENPGDAAFSLAAAARAAYCNNRLLLAIDYITQAIQLASDVAQYHFDSSKYLFASNNFNAGIKGLRQSILLDGLYSVKWQDEKDFQSYKDRIEGMIEDWRQEMICRIDDLRALWLEFLNFSETDTAGRLFDRARRWPEDDFSYRWDQQERMRQRFRNSSKGYLAQTASQASPTFIGAALMINTSATLVHDCFLGLQILLNNWKDDLKNDKQRYTGMFGLSKTGRVVLAHNESKIAEAKRLETAVFAITRKPLAVAPRFPTLIDYALNS